MVEDTIVVNYVYKLRTTNISSTKESEPKNDEFKLEESTKDNIEIIDTGVSNNIDDIITIGITLIILIFSLIFVSRKNNKNK